MSDPKTRKLSHYFTHSKRKGRPGLPLASVTMHNGLVPRADLERDKERKTKTSLAADDHSLVEPGDIAYNMMRMWQGAFGLASAPVNVSPAYVVMRAKPTLEPRFAAQWLKSDRALYLLWAYSYGLTDDRLRLYPKEFLRIPVVWPDVAEQRRIAIALESWDDAIALCERLVETKQASKAALAETLLMPALATTPMEGWRTYRLGQLFTERNETAPNAELLSITSSRGVVRRDDLDRKDSSSPDKTKYKKIMVGDIGYNTMRMWQGVSALSSLEGIVSPAYTVIRPNSEISGEFSAQLFKLPAMIHRFWSYSQGLVDDTLSLKFTHFRQIRISIPDLSTQDRISRILKGLDNEIAEQRALASLLRSQKRGLMQKIFTGDSSAPGRIDALLSGDSEATA